MKPLIILFCFALFLAALIDVPLAYLSGVNTRELRQLQNMVNELKQTKVEIPATIEPDNTPTVSPTKKVKSATSSSQLLSPAAE